MKKLFLIISLVTLLMLPGAGFAATRTINGIPVTDVDYGPTKGITAEFFTAYTLTTTKVYNESGSTSATSGMVDVSIYPLKTIGFRLTDISGGGTATFNVNEFIGTTTHSIKALTLSIGSTATEYSIPISEYCQAISVDGVMDTGTAIADVIGVFVYEKQR